MLYKIYVGKTDASFTNGGLRFAVELVKIFHLSRRDFLLSKSYIKSKILKLYSIKNSEWITENSRIYWIFPQHYSSEGGKPRARPTTIILYGCSIELDTYSVRPQQRQRTHADYNDRHKSLCHRLQLTCDVKGWSGPL